jgi:hypothetical protein
MSADGSATPAACICENLRHLRFQNEIEWWVDLFCYLIDADVTGIAALVGK